MKSFYTDKNLPEPIIPAIQPLTLLGLMKLIPYQRGMRLHPGFELGG